MFSKALLALAALVTGGAVMAQTPPAAGIAFGNKVTQASIVSALQAAGFQALAAGPPTPPPGTAANPNVLGTISSGINGAKVLIVVNKCPNAPTDDVCTINLITTFTDQNGKINNDTLNLLNQRSTIVKVLAQKKGEQTTGFSLIYTYVCKDIDDPKFITPVLATFGADVATVAGVYNTQLPGTNPPAAPVAK
jgi:hypothetical protein